jgi:hypothetical protein
MEERKKTKIILLSILVLFLSVSVTESAFAYGEGGNKGGGGDEITGGLAPTKNSDIVKEYTREELEDFFSGLPDGVREMVIDKQEGKPRTPAQLNLIRNIFLEAENWNQQSTEAVWQSYEEIAVVLDQAGQKAEFVLTFVPGTGWVVNAITGTAFGTVREGVNAYSAGGSNADIAQAMAVNIALSQIMKFGSLEKLGSRGNELLDMVSRAGKLQKNSKVWKYLARVGAKAVGYKVGEELTKNQIKEILNYIANEAKTAEVRPISPPPMIYRNQAGIW